MRHRGAWRLPEGSSGDESGFSLLEVVVAVVVLMVVLLPVADLLTSTGQVVAGSQFRVQAQDLATAELTAVQSVAASRPGAFVADFGSSSSTGIDGPPVQLDQPSTTGGSLQWSTQAPQVETVQGQHFQVVTDGGWCATPAGASDTSTQWGSSGSGPPAFVVAVLAAWGLPRAGTDVMAEPHVIDIGAVMPPAGWVLPQEPASFFAYCPAGLP